MAVGTKEIGSVLKISVIGADNLSCLVAHACTEFVGSEPFVIYPRVGKAAELSEPVESEDQACAVGVKKF